MGAKPTLLAGGNPQIAKADGDAPVQAYIAAMPGWKRDVGCRLDALIVRTVPDVRKALRGRRLRHRHQVRQQLVLQSPPGLRDFRVRRGRRCSPVTGAASPRRPPLAPSGSRHEEPT